MMFVFVVGTQSARVGHHLSTLAKPRKKESCRHHTIQFMGTLLAKSYLKYEKELQTLSKDLTVLSYLPFVPSAFLKIPKRSVHPVDSNGFDFKSWSSIGTEVLIKTDSMWWDKQHSMPMFALSINAHYEQNLQRTTERSARG